MPVICPAATATTISAVIDDDAGVKAIVETSRASAFTQGTSALTTPAAKAPNGSHGVVAHPYQSGWLHRIRYRSQVSA